MHAGGGWRGSWRCACGIALTGGCVCVAACAGRSVPCVRLMWNALGPEENAVYGLCVCTHIHTPTHTHSHSEGRLARPVPHPERKGGRGQGLGAMAGPL